MLQILIAILAGALTIAAPCILPLLPILLGTSLGQTSKTRPLFIVLGFVITFSVIALLLSSFTHLLGLSPNVLRDVAIVMLSIFGLLMIWPRPFEFLMARFMGVFGSVGGLADPRQQSNISGLVLGLTLGIVWTPCAGPVLGSILTLIAAQKDLLTGGILLVAYAIGASVPMLIIAYGGQYITKKVGVLSRYSRVLELAFGIIIILLALALYFNYDTKIYALFLNTPAQETTNNTKDKVELNDYGEAPDFKDIATWLNSQPLTIASLKGKVVLIDFWTYSCINCIRTLPHVTKWYDTYRDKGLVVVGVHTPEFAFEKQANNVQDAIRNFKINYPVALDNDYGTWNNYTNQYWPAEYLIDQKGHIVYTHFGEGNYDHTENAIRSLLGLGQIQIQNAGAQNQLTEVGSPEMYFGTDRLQNLTTEQKPSLEGQSYTFPKDLKLNTFALQGSWQFSPDNMILTKSGGMIRLKFHAGKVHMVAESQSPAEISIVVDGKAQPSVVIYKSQLYTLFNSDDYSDHVIEITIPKTDFKGFTFTFG